MFNSFEEQLLPSEIKLAIDNFNVIQFVPPCLSFLALFSGPYFSRISLWVARHCYDARLKQWPDKVHWLVVTILHNGERYFNPRPFLPGRALIFFVSVF